MLDVYLLSEWGDFLFEQGLSDRTISAYQNAVENLIGWYVENKGKSFNPSMISSDDLFRWKHDQVDAGLARSTVNQRLSAVRQFFTWINLIGRRHDNPASAVISLSVSETSADPISPEDEGRLIREANKRCSVKWGEFVFRDRAMILLMLRAGLRVSELLQLRVVDVDLRKRSGRVFVMGSVGREIDLDLQTREALGVYLDHGHPAPEDPSKPLWYGLQGPVSSRSTVNRMLSRYADFARLEDRDISPQRLRDTFAKGYLKKNPGDLQGLAEVMELDSMGSSSKYV